MTKNFVIRMFAVFCILKIVGSTHHRGSSEESTSREIESSEECQCGDRINLICGSDGKTYQNICFFTCRFKRNRKLKIVPCRISSHRRQDKDEDDVEVSSNSESTSSQSSEEKSGKTSCACPRDYMHPVCGSNGKTYPSKCLLKCARKRVNGLRVTSQGRCPVERKNTRVHKKSSKNKNKDYSPPPSPLGRGFGRFDDSGEDGAENSDEPPPE